MQPSVGQLVRVRSRQYLVEDVEAATSAARVRLSCLEDDSLGEPLEVLWEAEIDAKILGGAAWKDLGARGFDQARLFSAYLHALRWNLVTATEPRLFQAPYRAGIEVKAYQLEPLSRALRMPRVNLFIADDVGLGKTIEAGLILRELLLRQRVRRVVIACPSSVVLQWRDEMEARFGLQFVVLDREYVRRMRQERGFAVNPWKTHSRFIVSHALLRDEAYASPLRDWLSDRAATLLILDEAHNVAPASGAKYAIDSKLTKVVRDIARHFEHKLFLSATPHNGHSNSFSALLEILDPQRFIRGVPVGKASKLLDQVMIRRLKKDLREIEPDFPDRHVEPIVINDLPDSAPELELSRLLQLYRSAREGRFSGASKSEKASAMLVVTSLQKRLLSSIEAFARTLEVHRKTIEKRAATQASQVPLSLDPPDADDERADLDEDEVSAQDEAQIAAATAAMDTPSQEERDLLASMAAIAARSRHDIDPRLRHLIDWVERELHPGGVWQPRRALVFTEYADTKRWLVQHLVERFGAERIGSYHGGMNEAAREQVKEAFNADPAKQPLRLLIATDAAREGVNLQNHCADLFHFDVPWNPGRMEQRNGRIDRKLQKAKDVYCRYFALPQRAEDRVLEVLVEKTAIIHEQLGSLPPVLERRLGGMFDAGISHARVDELRASIRAVEPKNGAVVEDELEETRKRRDALQAQINDLRKQMELSQKFLQFDERHFRDALSAAVELAGGKGLQPAGNERWQLPSLDESLGRDPAWAPTLDTLRVPRRRDQDLHEWRRDAPVRPIVFRDPGTLDGAVVHLHLEHRIAQRLLGRFLAQGFVHHELSRACVLLTDAAVPHVIALGRLSLYGGGASRLHDEIIATAAEWRADRKLKRLNEGEKESVLALIETSLATPRLREVHAEIRQKLLASVARDVAELSLQLEKRADIVEERAARKLKERGEREAKDLKALLESQRERIQLQQREVEEDRQQRFAFAGDEARQLAADQRAWKQRLADLETEVRDEPKRVEESYEVRARRVEPVGIVYLWPASG